MSIIPGDQLKVDTGNLSEYISPRDLGKKCLTKSAGRNSPEIYSSSSHHLSFLMIYSVNHILIIRPPYTVNEVHLMETKSATPYSETPLK